MTAHDETPDTSHAGHETPDHVEPDEASVGPAPAANRRTGVGAVGEDAGSVGEDPGAGRSRRSISAWALGGGTDPDPRFTLANERTFLAWIRTSLAMVAGGIAVEAFTSELFTPEIRKTVAVLLLLLGLVTGGGSFFRWLNVERAMRRQAPLPLPLIAPILAAGGAVVAAVLIVFVIWRPA
jgi:putative membrane protein